MGRIGRELTGAGSVPGAAIWDESWATRCVALLLSARDAILDNVVDFDLWDLGNLLTFKCSCNIQRLVCRRRDINSHHGSDIKNTFKATPYLQPDSRYRSRLISAVVNMALHCILDHVFAPTVDAVPPNSS